MISMCDSQDENKPWPRGYKTFVLLISAEHEICATNKSQTIVNSFLLYIAEHENFSANKYENANYC